MIGQFCLRYSAPWLYHADFRSHGSGSTCDFGQITRYINTIVHICTIGRCGGASDADVSAYVPADVTLIVARFVTMRDECIRDGLCLGFVFQVFQDRPHWKARA